LEETAAFKKYCEDYGWGSQSGLARKIGKSQEFVSHRIKLLELPERVRIALTHREISLGSAQELVWLKDAESKSRFALKRSNQNLSPRRVREVVKALNTFPSKDVGNSDENQSSRFDYPISKETKENDVSKTIGVHPHSPDRTS